MTKSSVCKDIDSSGKSNEVIVQMCTDSENEDEEGEEDNNNEDDDGSQPQIRSGQKTTPSLSPATSLHVTPAKQQQHQQQYYSAAKTK